MLPKGMKVVPKKGETRPQARERLEAKYGDPPPGGKSGKGNQAARAAARFGKAEVREEEKGNISAARKLGKAEAREQAKAGGSGTPTRSSAANANSSIDRGGRRAPYEHLQLGSTYRIPEPVLRELYNGRRMGTDVYIERDFANRAGAYILPYGDVNWAFQSGDTPNVNLGSLGNWMGQMFTSILRTVQAQRLINISNVSLANPTPAPSYPVSYIPNSVQAWLRTYCIGAMLTRMFESCLVAGDLNYVMSLISDSVMQQLQLLEAVSRKLRGIRVPQPLMDLIDKASGVKMIDDYSTPIIYGSFINPQTDFTVTANVNSLLLSADQFLSQTVNPGLGGGPGANMANDFQIIQSMFALAYGAGPTWRDKGVDFNVGEYYQAYGAAAQWRDTTATAHWYVNPSIAISPFVPILIPKEASEEDAKHLMSLMGVGRYSTDAVPLLDTSTPNIAGIFPLAYTTHPVAAGFGFNFGRYTPAGTFSAINEVGTAVALTDWTTDELELMAWLAYARGQNITPGTTYGSDRRVFSEFDIIKMRDVDLIDATQDALEDTFISTILYT